MGGSRSNICRKILTCPCKEKNTCTPLDSFDHLTKIPQLCVRNLSTFFNFVPEKKSSYSPMILAVKFKIVVAPLLDPPDRSRAGPDSHRSTSPRPAASAAPSCCT